VAPCCAAGAAILAMTGCSGGTAGASARVSSPDTSPTVGARTAGPGAQVHIKAAKSKKGTGQVYSVAAKPQGTVK